MVTLPIEFVETKYPGYFWNTETKTLFSLKIDGVLKELRMYNPNRWNNWPMPGYRVSVKGRGRYLSIGYLKGLKFQTVYEIIPVKERETREERIARRISR